MDNADLINVLNTLINDLQGHVLDAQQTLDDLEREGVPGTDVENDVRIDVLRTILDASYKIV